MALTTAAALANTAAVVRGADRLARADQLEVFLTDHGLAARRQLDAADLDQAHDVRGVLREVFSATDEQAAVDALNALLVEAGARPQLTPCDGHGWRWHLDAPPDAPPVAHLTAVTAAGLLTLIHDDGLARLHGCAADGCAGVFVDTTRNRSRRYCIPELCGNRTNLARHRARRQAAERHR
jgi:predicted RNA-binding Zn ribbon-like protein